MSTVAINDSADQGWRVSLVENGPPANVIIETVVADALRATGLVEVTPGLGGGWALKPSSGKVGAVRAGTRAGALEVHVAPKLPIARVMFLLAYSVRGARWQRGDVEAHVTPDLLPAMVEVFERTASRALRRGLLLGYREVEESLTVLRGRIREAEQLRRRFGLPVPMEVRYDDFTADTAENRLLRAAVLRARRLPGLTHSLTHRLIRLELQLADVTPVPAARLEPWRPSRLNARLVPALRLAELLLASSSFDLGGSGVAVSGVVLDLWQVFEDFVCSALGSALLANGGSVATQYRCHLDEAGAVAMRPDLVWLRRDVPVAVVDAKYKAEQPAGFPDADLYQALAYATALRLSVAHLVYAAGLGLGARHVVRGSGVVVAAHTLDLDAAPAALLAQVFALAQVMARDAGIREVAGAA